MTTEIGFLEQLQALAPSEYLPTRFPLFHVDKQGDCLEVILSDEAFNGERIDGRITIYRSVESGEFVGVLVKGLSTWISRVLDNFPGMILDLNEPGRFQIELFFAMEQFRAGDKKLAMYYQKLRLAAKSWSLDIKEIGYLQKLNTEMTHCG